MRYKVIYSQRKTLCLEIDRELNVIVRAPRFAKRNEIESFVSGHEDWIAKHLKSAEERRRRLPRMPEDKAEILELKEKLARILPERVEKYSALLNLYPTGVKVTCAKTRYGSCSSKNSLCFSCVLALFPLEAIDYVVVHELCHIRFKNHGKDFYALVKSVMPDYREREKLLRG